MLHSLCPPVQYSRLCVHSQAWMLSGSLAVGLTLPVGVTVSGCCCQPVTVYLMLVQRGVRLCDNSDLWV